MSHSLTENIPQRIAFSLRAMSVSDGQFRRPLNTLYGGTANLGGERWVPANFAGVLNLSKVVRSEPSFQTGHGQI